MGERIVIEDITKGYSGAVLALGGISLEVEASTFLVLLGPSGSGKTTLLRCVAGIERISAGRITVGESVVADGSRHLAPERRNLSMVFQDYALWPHLVVRDNVAFALRRRGLRGERARAVADQMLEKVGLARYGDRYPSQLSGGEQQRVALARALVGETGIVLCDEPLSNLDADLRERMRLEIASLVREAGATTVYITHDQAEAFALADRIGVLQHGRLVQVGAPEEIYWQPASPFVARFTGLAGEIDARITQVNSDGTVSVWPLIRAASAPITARLAGTAVAGTVGTLMIRPTVIALCASDDAERHLVGTVTDVAFRGRGYEHAVTLDGGVLVSGVFSSARATRGETVGLRLAATGSHLFCELDEERGARPSARLDGDLNVDASADESMTVRL